MRPSAAEPLRRHRRGCGRGARCDPWPPSRRAGGRRGRAGRLVAAMSRRNSRIRTLAVTGGTGFVGQHLLKMALAEGYDVRALTRGWKPPEDATSWVDGALDRPESLVKLAADADAVIHIAGLINGDRAAFDAVNVGGTAAMIDA